MSILIKGADMPEKCEECWFFDTTRDENFCKWTGAAYNMEEHCPFVEVKTPHGRLIDADRLKAENPRHMDIDVPYVSEVTVEEIIDDAPTVIESEE